MRVRVSIVRPTGARLLGTLAAVLLWVAAPASAQSSDEHSQMDTNASELVIKAFGAVEWGTSELKDTSNSFAVGQLALFVSAPVSERISVLAEIVMESGVNTRVVTDLERLLLTYRMNDSLQISAGRYHTGIGFYNAAFHHGAYFDTAIGRPRVYFFEDEGGVLPVHDVGLTVRGTIPNTGSALRYVAEVGNGRDWEPTTAQAEGGRDQNEAKATNVGVSYLPERWRGLELGGSFYRDTIPRAASGPVAHRIGNLYVAYRKPRVELLAEWLRLWFRAEGSSGVGNNAGYLQVSRSWGVFRPYYRYDRLSLEPSTPIVGALPEYKGHTVGLRLDPVERLGLKFQYERSDEGAQRGIDALRTQLVFVF
jgi:hypothetical protein